MTSLQATFRHPRVVSEPRRNTAAWVVLGVAIILPQLPAAASWLGVSMPALQCQFQCHKNKRPALEAGRLCGNASDQS
jgi:hypothetical protein